MTGWLPLNEYSTKFNMSISTLRRRIRNSEVEFQFRDGKYWLKDENIPRGYKTSRPIQSEPARPSFQAATNAAPAPLAVPLVPSSKTEAPVAHYNLLEQFKDTKPVVPVADHTTNQALEVADRLVAELKAAYVLILQEKEEMILQLKEEVSDLKTLTRILESENERLKKESSDNSGGDSATGNVDFETTGSAMDRWLDEPLDI